jgi:CubicO group peptidase (beta-lactamase class C family)
VTPAARHDPGLQALVDAVHGRGDLPAVAVAVLDGDADVVAWAGAGAATAPGLRLRVASVTKTAVALTAHRLAAAGTVDLDAPAGGGARVADLLSHTAGLPMELAGVDWLTTPPADVAALDALLARQARPRGPAPFRYSNTGFWLLDQVLRTATGATTDELVADTLAPLDGCAEIGFGEPDLTGNLATASGRTVPSVARFFPPRRPSGGLTASLPAVAWLGRALLAAAAVTPALREERVAIADGWGWTAGLERWTTAGRVLLGHSGSWGGTRTLLVLDPRDGRVAVASVTSDAGAPALRALLSAIGLPPASPEQAAPEAPHELPLGTFADPAVAATLEPDPGGDGGLLLRYPADAAPVRARRVSLGLARLLDGSHAGEALTTTPTGDVLRIGIRSLDRAP